MPIRKMPPHKQPVIRAAQRSTLLALCLAFSALVLGSADLLAQEPATEEDEKGDVIEGSLTVDGRERSYRLFLPSRYSERKKRQMPLLLALHGGRGNAEQMKELSGFDELAEEKRFIVAYPNAIDHHWNDGRQVTGFRSHRENIDDVEFLMGLIGALTEQYNVDRKRIYLAGVSNGAMMALRVACEKAASISAVASVVGALPENVFRTCRPSRPVPVIMINGTEDHLVLWQGGPVRLWGSSFGTTISVPRTVQHYVTQYGCRGQPDIENLKNINPKDGTNVARHDYKCQGRLGIRLYRVNGGGHRWPGAEREIFPNILGLESKDIDASLEIWNFLSGFRRPVS